MRNSKLNQVLIGIFLCGMLAACKTPSRQAATKIEAPAYFKAQFETSKGVFEIESRREWSPAGVDRLYQLIKSGFYRDIAVFRVIPDYIAQFGIHNDSTINGAWSQTKLEDEPVVVPNMKGTISFARGGPASRGTSLFVNLNNNSPRLDTISFMGVRGFPVVAQITSGFDVAYSFYNGYGRALDTKQDTIQLLGNEYLRRNYPELDYIVKARIMGKE
ncbi:MAG: peptidylprolyl isomerase [Cyclobacteriaceae bacterium]